MDFSQGYVRICATPELQDLIPLVGIDLGDFVAVENEDTGKFFIGRINNFSLKKSDDESSDVEELEDFSVFYPIVENLEIPKPEYFFVKLFTQDEIQEVLMDELKCTLYKLLLEFNHFFINEISNEGLSDVFDTLEKCWANFYVYKKRGLIWGGTKWIKCKKFK